MIPRNGSHEGYLLGGSIDGRGILSPYQRSGDALVHNTIKDFQPFPQGKLTFVEGHDLMLVKRQVRPKLNDDGSPINLEAEVPLCIDPLGTNVQKLQFPGSGNDYYMTWGASNFIQEALPRSEVVGTRVCTVQPKTDAQEENTLETPVVTQDDITLPTMFGAVPIISTRHKPTKNTH